MSSHFTSSMAKSNFDSLAEAALHSLNEMKSKPEFYLGNVFAYLIFQPSMSR